MKSLLLLLVSFFLFCSCQNKSELAKEELIDLGFSFTHKDFIEQVDDNNAKAVGLYADALIDLEKEEQMGTPLLRAIWFERYEVAKVLVDKGANIHALSRTGGKPPLYYAMLHSSQSAKDIAFVEYFLLRGVDPNLCGGKSMGGYPMYTTPLMDTYNEDEVVWARLIKLLLSHGAEINYVTPNRNTVLDDVLSSYAKDVDTDKVIRLLKANGAKTYKELIAEKGLVELDEDLNSKIDPLSLKVFELKSSGAKKNRDKIYELKGSIHSMLVEYSKLINSKLSD